MKNNTSVHKHVAIKTLEDRPWFCCVNPDGCNGVPHGNCIDIEICSCGARREIEFNAGQSTSGKWYKNTT
jgi:hypothetical protein